MTADKRNWFVAAETKRPKIKHINGHKRLGPGYSKCGKMIDWGRQTAGLTPCGICSAEYDREENEAPKLQRITAIPEQVPADPPQIRQPDTLSEEDAERYQLLAVLRAQHEAIDTLLARLVGADPQFMPSKSGQPWAALLAGNQLIKRLEGR